MKITGLQKQVENLPEKLRTSILAIIEIKTESDMEKVLREIQDIEKRLGSKMGPQFRVLPWVISTLGILITVYKFIG